ncbi:MAG: YabP/YqfC family sporulation protein [Lachnospiraceae bacterium]|nr:YabP/YqfC family sporulation protein [Lachnospiraceae bacterium]MDD3615881.1 YabP/YqfC family sporulation protein [Lachnospiraceae bacterium]
MNYEKVYLCYQIPEWVCVENYKKLLMCTSDQIILSLKDCRVEIEGKHLQIKYYSKNEMRIEGCIETISYHK